MVFHKHQKINQIKAEVIPKGYITDLASVPRMCWAFIAPFDVARAAVIHDILYEKINGAFKEGVIATKKDREIYRSIADNIFKQGMQIAILLFLSGKLYPLIML